MEKVKVTLENCYGIESLSHTFEFSKQGKGRVCVVYAPNGTMKTSFAKTFKDLKNPKDLIHEREESKASVEDEQGNPIEQDRIFVIESMNENFASERIATILLNNPELRKEYEEIRKRLSMHEEKIIEILKTKSTLKKDDEIKTTFLKDMNLDGKNDFLPALAELESLVNDPQLGWLAQLIYKDVVSEKIEKLLKSQGFQGYKDLQDELFNKSKFFKKNDFNYHNAQEIKDKLDENNFFKPGHYLCVKTGDNEGDVKPIKTAEELKLAIDQELDRIKEGLKNELEKLNKEFTNKESKSFLKILEQYPVLFDELSNEKKSGFKKRLWASYLASDPSLYKAFIDEFKKSKPEIERIRGNISSCTTEWDNVVEEFKRRFEVPFTVKIENRHDCVLGLDELPSFAFEFEKKEAKVSKRQKDLWNILSSGEKRALYLLNIIYEVQSRKQNGSETLFIIDDIADSFDYKNKYAIIQYLDDIGQESNFYQIILTHNFDFYRTVCSRLAVGKENRFHVESDHGRIELIKDKESPDKTPFCKWKKEMNTKKLIASIPFVRNLAEYCGASENKKKLTQLMHYNKESEETTLNEVMDILKKVVEGVEASLDPKEDGKVYDKIYDAADKIIKGKSNGIERIELEDKIILSMAIRLKAEKFMIQKLDGSKDLDDIKKNQMRKLFDAYVNNLSKNKTDGNAIKVLKDVLLMTPENIHINAFMYEPILDMSSHRLKELYKEVCELK